MKKPEEKKSENAHEIRSTHNVHKPEAMEAMHGWAHDMRQCRRRRTPLSLARPRERESKWEMSDGVIDME